jgi:hypothetical protein
MYYHFIQHLKVLRLQGSNIPHPLFRVTFFHYPHLCTKKSKNKVQNFEDVEKKFAISKTCATCTWTPCNLPIFCMRTPCIWNLPIFYITNTKSFQFPRSEFKTLNFSSLKKKFTIALLYLSFI